MAYTVSGLSKTEWGDKRVSFVRVTADSAENVVDTGLSRIDSFSYAPGSVTTSLPKCFINAGTTSTYIGGFIGLSGVTNGDVIFLTAYGV